ncbi:SCP2 domain-containing protein [Shewanella sp. Scap07]|uniref:ubiquinone anaerobic biosynthesis accessory factor UbiT n=1 Tax=Shewanella sp. Scap07 TaxID=2589987 RepID=UPI0015BA486C|nr:SCP2 sterol-binding domain-containing protein [Shewanella sp. Scap07]QLE87734.1 SCP2 domain-containing protein [Shewanella sp. Scap07]
MQSRLFAHAAKQLLNHGPQIVAKPLQLVPFAVKGQALQSMLSLILKQQIIDEELDFLEQRWVGINITDMDLRFEVSFDGQICVAPSGNAEVVFSGNSKDLLLIAAGKEDPDTLFFQRKLTIEGDTELGLEVKNLLLGVEFDTMPAPLRDSIDKLAELLQYLQRQAPINA